MGSDGIFTLRRVEGDLFIFKPSAMRNLKKNKTNDSRLSHEGNRILLSQIRNFDAISETHAKRLSGQEGTSKDEGQKRVILHLDEDKKPNTSFVHKEGNRVFDPKKIDALEESEESVEKEIINISFLIKPQSLGPLEYNENELKVPPSSMNTTPKLTTLEKNEFTNDEVQIRDLSLDKTRIYIHVPADNDVPGRAYATALMVFKTVTEQDLLTRAQLAELGEEGLYIKSSNQAEPYLNGTWKITLRSQKLSCWQQLKNLLPATHKYEDTNIIHLDIKKISDTLIKKVKESAVFQITIPLSAVFNEKFDPKALLIDRLQTPSFGDPWTWLSARYVQQHEIIDRYVAEKNPNSTGKFLYKDGVLSIVPLNSPMSNEDKKKVDTLSLEDHEKFVKAKKKEELKQIKETFFAYIKFIHAEFGEKWVSRIWPIYGFDLVDMAKKGLSLTPDHVYQINILVNNLQSSYLRHVYKNILLCQRALKDVDRDNTIESIWGIGGDRDLSKYFPIRVLRAICSHLSSHEQVDKLPTIKEFKAFLDKFNGGKQVRYIKQLDAEAYRMLIRLLAPSEGVWRATFTGRQRCDGYDSEKAYPTTGKNIDAWNPNSELHDKQEQDRELLECLIPDLDITKNWGSGMLSKKFTWFLERFAHVESKKTPFWPKASKENKFQFEWSSLALIPGPKDKKNMDQYYETNVYEDGEGLCLYTLSAANNNFEFDGRPLPTIFSPRSTAANSKSFGGTQTVKQDTKIEIGTDDDMQKALPYIKNIIEPQAMPFWVGYKTWAEQLQAEGKDKEALEKYEQAFVVFRRYLKLQKEYHHVDTIERKTIDESLDKAEFFESMKKDKSEFSKLIEQMRDKDKDSNIGNRVQLFKVFLNDAAKKLGLRIEDKKKIDAVFTGHSLGGAHAAQILYVITNRLGLMPLPGYQWLNCLFDSVQVSAQKNSAFMKLMRQHGEMFAAINKDTGIKPFASRVYIQIGDPVSTSGEKNLFSGFDEKADGGWCDFQFATFEVLATAQHPDITMQIPVHTPRFLSAKEGLDYVWKVLSSKDLQHYEDSYFFSIADLKKYKVPAPAAVELSRKIAGLFGVPILEFLEYFDPQVPVLRDSKGVFYPKREFKPL